MPGQLHKLNLAHLLTRQLSRVAGADAGTEAGFGAEAETEKDRADIIHIHEHALGQAGLNWKGHAAQEPSCCAFSAMLMWLLLVRLWQR